MCEKEEQESDKERCFPWSVADELEFEEVELYESFLGSLLDANELIGKTPPALLPLLGISFGIDPHSAIVSSRTPAGQVVTPNKRNIGHYKETLLEIFSLFLKRDHSYLSLSSPHPN